MQIKKTNNLNETTFESINKHGNILRGIIHTPAKSNGIGLILTPAGTKSRVGAHNFYVKLARRLVKSGYTILRADTEGIGYSDGEHFKGYTIDAWKAVQLGVQVDDVSLLVESFKQKYKLSNLVIGGICGAAVTAEYVAKNHPTLVNGILSINPTIVEIQKAGLSAQNSAITTQKEFSKYTGKIFNIKSWTRIFMGKSDLKVMFDTVIPQLKMKLFVSYTPPGVDKKYWDSLHSTINRKINHLFVFSGNDANWNDFQESIQPTILNTEKAKQCHTVVEIKNANHELHFENWQQQAYNSIHDWLDTSYCEEFIIT